MNTPRAMSIRSFVTAKYVTGHAAIYEANLEWRFAKHYGLETAFGDAAVGRVNLFWTIRS